MKLCGGQFDRDKAECTSCSDKHKCAYNTAMAEPADPDPAKKLGWPGVPMDGSHDREPKHCNMSEDESLRRCGMHFEYICDNGSVITLNPHNVSVRTREYGSHETELRYHLGRHSHGPSARDVEGGHLL